MTNSNTSGDRLHRQSRSQRGNPYIKQARLNALREQSLENAFIISQLEEYDRSQKQLDNVAKKLNDTAVARDNGSAVFENEQEHAQAVDNEERGTKLDRVDEETKQSDFVKQLYQKHKQEKIREQRQDKNVKTDILRAFEWQDPEGFEKYVQFPDNPKEEDADKHVAVVDSTNDKYKDDDIYSSQKQWKLGQKSIEEYDNQFFGSKIEQLTPQLENIKQQLQSTPGIPSMYVTVQNLQTQYSQLTEELDDLTKHRDRFLLTAKQTLNPELSVQHVTSSMLAQSDKYKTLSDLEKKWRSVVNLQRDTFLQTGSSDDRSDYYDNLSKWNSTRLELNKYSDTFNRFQDYITHDMKGNLPKSIEDVPDEFKGIARDMFYKNGKDLLTDKEYRKEAIKSLIIFPEQFKDILKNIDEETKSERAASATDLEEQYEKNTLLMDVAREEYKKTDEYKEWKIASMQPQATRPETLIYGLQGKEARKYAIANEIIKDALHQKELYDRVLANSQTAGLGFKNAGIAAKEFFIDDWENTYFFDSKTIRQQQVVANAVEDFNQNGKDKMSQASKDLLGAYNIKGIYDNIYNPNNIAAYRNAMVASQSMKFMAEFIATSGVSSSLQGIAKGGIASVKYGLMKEFIKEGVHGTKTFAANSAKGIAQKALFEGFAKFGAAAKVLGASALMRGAADIGYATFLTSTIGLPKTYADALTLHNGKPQGEFDRTGNFKLSDVEDAMSWGEAWSVSSRRNFIENLSEMMGEWGLPSKINKIFTSVPHVGKTLEKIEDAISAPYLHVTGQILPSTTKEIQNAINRYMTDGIKDMVSVFGSKGIFKYIPKINKVFNAKVLQAGQFHGVFGETLEEYYGIALNHAFGTEDNKNVGMFDDMVKQTDQIVGGIGLSTAILGAIGMGSSIVQQVKFNNKVQNLLNSCTKEEAEEIMRKTIFAPAINLHQVHWGLQQMYGKGSVRSTSETISDFVKRQTPNKATAIAEYVHALQNLRGAVFGEEMTNLFVDHAYKQMILRARDLGYDSFGIQTQSSLEDVRDIFEQTMRQSFAEINENSSTQDFITNHGGVENIKQIVKDIYSGNIKLNDGVDKSEAVKQLLTYVHSNEAYEESIKATVGSKHDTALNAANKLFRLAGQDGKIRILRKKRQAMDKDGKTPLFNEDGSIKYETNENGEFIYDTLYWLGGNLKTDTARLSLLSDSQYIDTGFTDDSHTVRNKTYENDDQDDHILVANFNGDIKNIWRSELKDWELVDGAVEVSSIWQKRYDQVADQYEQRRIEFRKSFGDNVTPGEYIKIAEKGDDGKYKVRRVTILGIRGDGSIQFSVSDEDGKNARIMIANNVNDVSETISKMRRGMVSDITKMIKDNVEDYLKKYWEIDQQADINNINQQEAAELKQIDEFNKKRSNTDSEDAISRRDQNRFDAEVARDFDDTIDAGALQERDRQRKRNEADQKRFDAEVARGDVSDEIDYDSINKQNEDQTQYLLLVSDAIRKANGLISTDVDNSDLHTLFNLIVDCKELLDGTLVELKNDSRSTKDIVNQILDIAKLLNSVRDKAEIRKAMLEDAEKDRTIGNDQNAVYKQLREDSERSSSKEHKVATTSAHYFIQEGNRVVLRRRVHSVMPDRYDTDENIKAFEDAIAKYINQMNGVNSVKDWVDAKINELFPGRHSEDALTKALNQLMYDQVYASLQLDEYLKYLNEHPDEKDEVLWGIASCIIKQSDFENVGSVSQGNIHDTIYRIICDSEMDINSIPEYESGEYTIQMFGRIIDISKPLGEQLGIDTKLIDDNEASRALLLPIMSKDAFTQAIRAALKTREHYENVLGWKLCTVPYTLTGDFMQDGKIVKIAGETDCIAVDKNGDYRIIDFKTFNAKTRLFYPRQAPMQAALGNNVDIPSEFYNVRGSKERRTNPMFSQATQYTMQTTMYRRMLSQHGKTPASIEVLLIGISYTRFQVKLNDGSISLKISVMKSDDLVESKYMLDQSVQTVDELRNNDYSLDGSTPNREVLSEKLDDPDIKKWIEWLNENIKDVLQDRKDNAIQAIDQLQTEINALVLDQEIIDSGLSESVQAILNYIEKVKASDDIYVLESASNEIRNMREEVDYKLRQIQSNKKLLKMLEDRIKQEDEEHTFAVNTTLNNALNVIDGILSKYWQDNGKIDSDEIIDYDVEALRKWMKILGTCIRIKQILNEPVDPSVIRSYKYILTNIEQLDGVEAEVNSDDLSKVRLKKQWYQITTLFANTQSEYSVYNAVSEKGDRLVTVDNDGIATGPLMESDFITNGEFYIQNLGKYKGGTRDRFGIVVVYNGIKYSPIEIGFAHIDGFNSELTDSAKQFYKECYSRVPSVTSDMVRVNNKALFRNFGIFINGQMRQIDTNQLFGKDLKDIKFDHSHSDIGVTGIKNGRVSVSAPTKDGKPTDKVLYVYNGNNEDTNPAVGVVVALIESQYDELIDNGFRKKIPINLYSQTFDQKTAEFIWDILSGVHKSGNVKKLSSILQSKYKQGGKTYSFTNADVLNLFIQSGKEKQRVRTQPVSIIQTGDNKVSIVGKIMGVAETSTEFDLSTDKQKFIDFLVNNVKMAIDAEFMSANIKDTPFAEVVKGQSRFRFGNSCIEITEQDVKDNLGGIALYIKSGMLKSDFIQMGAPMMRIDEKTIFDTNDDSSDEGAPEFEVEEGPASLFDKRINDKNSTYELVEEQSARSEIKRLLGDLFVDGFDQDVLGMVGDSWVVGQCYYNMIKLSRLAPKGTEYHEAFHFILELLVDEKDRQKAYARYRKKYGKDKTDKEIAEFAADEFQWFMQNKPGKFTWKFGTILPQLARWYKFYTKIGSFRLYRLYKSADAGKFVDVRPNTEAIARFKKVATNGAFGKEVRKSLFSKNGVDFHYITNQRDFEACLDTVIVSMIHNDTLDHFVSMDEKLKDSSNITSRKLVRDRIIKNAASVVKSPFVWKILESPLYTNGSKLMFAEILGLIDENGNVMSKDDIMSGKKKPNDTLVKFKDRLAKIAKENRIDIDQTDDNDGTAAGDSLFDRPGHPSEKASDNVKFFMSCIEKREYVDVLINGKLSCKLVPSTNSAGLPAYMSFKESWNELLNRLNGATSIVGFYYKLHALAMNCPQYRGVLARYENLCKKAFVLKNGNWFDEETNKPNEVRENNTDVYGQIVEIVKTFGQVKVIPTVATNRNSYKEDADLSSMKIESAGYEFLQKQMRQNWSDNISSGEMPYLKKTENGQYYVPSGGRAEILKTIRTLNAICAKFSQSASNVLGQQSDVRSVIFPTVSNKENTTVVGHKKRLLSDIQYDPNTNSFKFYWNGKLNNKTAHPKDITTSAIKDLFLKQLQILGIDISLEALDYYLTNYYGGSDVSHFSKFIDDHWQEICTQLPASEANIDMHSWYNSHRQSLFGKSQSLCDAALFAIYDPAVFSSDHKQIQTLWSNANTSKNKTNAKYVKFIEVLVQIKYENQRDNHELQFLTIQGNTVYGIQEPCRLTDVVELINNDSNYVESMVDDPYNSLFVNNDGQIDRVSPDGSVLNAVRNGAKFEFSQVPGYKTDSVGSKGVEYVKLSEQEDIALKYGLLGAGRLILPTLSDKPTWGVLSSPKFRLLGLDYTQLYEDSRESRLTYINERYKTKQDGRYFNDDVLKYFLNCAELEYQSARFAEQRLGKLSDEEKVDNADVYKPFKNKDIVIAQAARLSTFTGIHKEVNGKTVFINFNQIYKEDGKTPYTEKELLDLAKSEFFDLNIEDKLDIIDRELRIQVDKEMQFLHDNRMLDLNDLNYDNLQIDRYKVKLFYGLLNRMDKDQFKAVSTIPKDQLYDAVYAYVADMTIKSQQSLQESIRLFSGNLSFFKWEYNEDGTLKNQTTDFFKRLGGLGSTGERNVLDAIGSNDVVAAEIFDEKLSGRNGLPAYITEFTDVFEKNALKQELIKRYRQYCRLYGKQEDAVSVDDDTEFLKTKLLEAAKEHFKHLVDAQDVDSVAQHELDTIVALYQNRLKALKKTNVNDGATYITDEFAERLLIKIGHYDSRVEKAFKKLREVQNVNENILELADAYNTIRHAFIGTQKYTAYGFREYDDTGNDGSYTPCVYEDKESGDVISYKRRVPYFDKTAYFPIFSCMASGYMKAVLQKMKEDHVDMLKTKSAIKFGGQGAKPLDYGVFDEWSKSKDAYDNFHFNTYVQKLSELRKQFNTDPHEGSHEMSLGTQYQKVVMSLIQDGQIYDIDGKKLGFEEMRDAMMEAMNGFTDARYDAFKKKYFKNNKLNVGEFMKALSKQLADRDANDELLNYLRVEDGKLIVPISVLGSTNWVQSIITSIVNKDLVDIVGPGETFYQRSAWAMEGKQQATWLCEDQIHYEINHGAPLQMLNEDKSTDCVLSIDFFDYIFEQHDKQYGAGRLNYQSFEAKKAWLIKHGIISGFDANLSTFKLKKGTVYKDKSGNVIEVKDDSDDFAEGYIWKNATANIVGYRIPTQAVSSIRALRCVDVIPAVNHTIILPKEITATTGSDFDIDKFFLSTMWYKAVLDQQNQDKVSDIADKLMAKYSDKYTDKQKAASYRNKDVAIRERYNALIEEKGYENTKDLFNDPDVGQEAKDLSKAIYDMDMEWKYERLTSDEFDKDKEAEKYYYNNIIKMQIALLKTADENMSQLFGSIDSDTSELIRIADELSAGEAKEEYTAFSATSLRMHIDSKLGFSIGKFGIGPYALNNNSQVLTYLYRVSFNVAPDDVLSLMNLTRLDRLVGHDNKPILSYLSGLINAHVDVAKDPYIRKLGVNAYSHNLVNLLIRTGYGADTFWFTTQPIMKQLYTVYDKACGILNISSEEEARSQWSRTSQAVHDFTCSAISQLIPDSNITKYDDIHKIKDKLKVSFHKEGIDLNQAIKALFGPSYKGDNQILKQIAINGHPGENGFTYIQHQGDSTTRISLDYNHIQALTLLVNGLLQEHASDLNDVVQNTKIDTKKQGKTVIEQMATGERFEKLCNNKQFKNLDKMIWNSYVGKRTNVALTAMTELLQSEVYEATPHFRNMVAYISKVVLNEDVLTANSASTISKMLNHKFVMDYFLKGDNCYCAKRGIVPDKLFFGDGNMYKELQKLKQKIRNDDTGKYSGIYDYKHRKFRNILLENLQCSTTVDDQQLAFNIDSEDISVINVARSGITPFTGKAKTKGQDVFANAQFIQLNRQVLDDAKSSDVMNAWEELLNYPNDEIRLFAEKLIVYSAIDGSQFGGNTDIFKYVPYSWMIGDVEILDGSDIQNNGLTYGEYVRYKLNEFSENAEVAKDIFTYNPIISQAEIDEMILDRVFDNSVVRTIKMEQLQNVVHTYTVEGSVVPAMFTVFNSNNDEIIHKHPRFVKIVLPGSENVFGTQRYVVYKATKHATITKTDNDGKIKTETYPVYTLVDSYASRYVGKHTVSVVNMREYIARDRFQTNNAIMSLLYGRTAYGSMSAEKLLELFVADTVKMQALEPDNQSLYALVESIRRNEEENPTSSQTDDRTSFVDSATRLHLEQVNPDKYTPMDEERASLYFMTNVINDNVYANLYGKGGSPIGRLFNVEYYKKRIKFEDGEEAWDPTFVLSFKGAKQKGLVEIQLNVEKGTHKPTGRVDIHFKTYTLVGGKTRYASVPLSEYEKNMLIGTAIMFVKSGYEISTHGELTKGGFKAINELNRFSKAVAKTGKTESVELKNSDGTKESVEIPIWKKDAAYIKMYEEGLIDKDGDISKSSTDMQRRDELLSKSTAPNMSDDLFSEINEQLPEFQDGVDAYIQLKAAVNRNSTFKQLLIDSKNADLNYWGFSLNNALTKIRAELQAEQSTDTTDCKFPF